MTSYRLLHGDCRDTLTTLPDASVQCCVTSPPYWGLRDYGTEAQIGMESTPDAYVAALVAVFREVRRVLKDDGVLWLNIGDCYDNKQLVMIPARVALALQADGWWLRDEVIWHKPRTTPFPANDRTVRAHESVFLLAKSERYFFDWAAIEEPAIYAGAVRARGKAFRLHGAAKANHLSTAEKKNAYGGVDGATIVVRETRRARSVWSINPDPYLNNHFATMPEALAARCVLAGSRSGDTVLDPFAGAGTTGVAALGNGRSFVGCEANAAYIDMARARLDGVSPLFSHEATA